MTIAARKTTTSKVKSIGRPNFLRMTSMTVRTTMETSATQEIQYITRLSTFTTLQIVSFIYFEYFSKSETASWKTFLPGNPFFSMSAIHASLTG